MSKTKAVQEAIGSGAGGTAAGDQSPTRQSAGDRRVPVAGRLVAVQLHETAVPEPAQERSGAD